MKRVSFLTVAFTIALTIMAQGTLEDYKRAYSIGSKYAGKTSNAIIQHQFAINDEVGKKMWFTTSERDGIKYYIIDLKTNKKESLFDTNKLASQMSNQLGKTVEARYIQNTTLYQTDNGNLGVKFIANGYNWS